jgi:putative hydrolase
LAGGVFEPQNTEAQNAALRRLETLLALIEGWVDTVVTSAAGERMQGAAALSEAVRRRRASGGPAEQTFSTLVGLELRPRRLREAAQLWSAMTANHGASVRDGLWNHPDLLPTADDLDDPDGFAAAYGTAASLQMSDLESIEQDQNSRPAEPDQPTDSSGSTDSSDSPDSHEDKSGS